MNLYPFEIILNTLCDHENSPEIIKLILAKLTPSQTNELLEIIQEL